MLAPVHRAWEADILAVHLRLRRRRGGGLDLALFLVEPGGLALELAQVVEARPAHLAVAHDLDAVDARAVDGNMRSTPTP